MLMVREQCFDIALARALYQTPRTGKMHGSRCEGCSRVLVQASGKEIMVLLLAASSATLTRECRVAASMLLRDSVRENHVASVRRVDV